MMTRMVLFRWLAATAIMAAIAMCAAADPVHVEAKGDDKNLGSADKPVATVHRAVELVAAHDGVQTIVVHEGVYRGGVVVPARENPPPLVICAAKRADGSYEDAILDGALPITEAAPVPASPGTFRMSVKTNTGLTYSLWEEDTRVRYTPMADNKTVGAVPASYLLTGTEVVFRTSDDQPPQKHRIAMARDDCGLSLQRAQVTVQGLQFRHFMLQRSSAGIRVNQGDVVIEDCRVWNARRGISVGTDAVNVKVVRCRTDDVGNGVFSYGQRLIVEDSQFFRKSGRFEVPEYSQDQSGVQCYHPARGAEVRRTLCVGFNLGLFFKCPPSRFIAEHNTVVGTGDSGFGVGCTSWFPESVFRHNVVAGYSSPLLAGANAEGIVPGAVVDGNCLWRPDGDRTIKMLVERKIGLKNINADPEFNDAEADDYRLQPDSPAAKLADGKPAGAYGVADDQPARLLPPVKGALDAAAERTLAARPAIAPEFVKRDGPPRAWFVAPDGSDDAAGSEDKPLKSFQIALNRANPGDRVVLMSGVYFGPHTLNHGGTEQAPIVIESSAKGRAVLDGMKRYDEACLAIVKAPHVIVKGLEVRWFKETGVQITESPRVQVLNCEFWNNDWSKGRRIGTAIVASQSPGLVVDHCLLYAMNNGMAIVRCPSFRITHTTVTKMLHRAAALIDCVGGSVFRNNSFTFTGNDHLAIRATEEEMKAFDCDYNNLAMYVRSVAPRRPVPEDDIQPAPGDFFRGQDSKAINSLNGERAFSLREWQERTGKDKHSIFKHPRYADPAKRDFRLLPDSPNIGAGKGGTNLGALGIKKD